MLDMTINCIPVIVRDCVDSAAGDLKHTATWSITEGYFLTALSLLFVD